MDESLYHQQGKQMLYPLKTFMHYYAVLVHRALKVATVSAEVHKCLEIWAVLKYFDFDMEIFTNPKPLGIEYFL